MIPVGVSLGRGPHAVGPLDPVGWGADGGGEVWARMLRVAGVLLGLALYIWFIVDVIRTPRLDVRTLPKFVWLLLVILIPLLGGLLWLFAGRPRPQRPRFGRRRSRGPVAPDDDPSFLRQIDQDTWSERMRRRRDGGADPASP